MKIRQLLFALLLSHVTVVLAQPAPQPKLSAEQAKDLAELMCSQLPNVGTLLETRTGLSSVVPAGPPQEPVVTDDVADALLRLGPYSLQCLTDDLLDARWMPDPRSEPLLGSPVVGDVAYMILMDKGVPDLLPQLVQKKSVRLGMDEYFSWPTIGDHRRRLQSAVQEWLIEHPDCCGPMPVVRSTEPAAPKFKMSEFDLENARNMFSRLRLGMGPRQVLKITGQPDAIDRDDADSPDHWHTLLLGICANNHNENLAYIYFIERWADEIARRDPLRDRYVIVTFSAEGKLTRMFSNVAGIAPILPPSAYSSWLRLAWGSGAAR